MISSESLTGGPSTIEWQIGEVIEDLYEVLWKTQGGMGAVYRVQHRGWNIDLAVKTPLPELVSSPQRMADFETEAETWVGLGLHPHIVACVYVRRLGGLPRVFAEWVDAGSLGEAIADRSLYVGTTAEALARILDVAIQFAWGLDYAHDRGLVHQDVKPDNVMRTLDWTMKVTDFGIASARAAAADQVSGREDTVEGSGWMTKAYCSPEQAAGGRTALTAGTDVWSWAISVWEMFTGMRPVQYGQTAAETFSDYVQDPWTEDDRIPAMPPAVAALLGRCFDLDPLARPVHIGELADELISVYPNVIGVPYSRTKPEPAKLLADGLNNQALSMLDLGRSEQAEQLWRQALTTDPNHPEAVYNYGLYRWRRGQMTDAQLINQLEAAQANHPGNPVGDYMLGAVHLERGDTTSARGLLAEAVRGLPADADITAAITAAHHQPGLASPRVLSGHAEPVTSVAISADGRVAVTGSHDKTIRVWDTESGECLHTLKGHTQSVLSVAVTADGRIALSSSADNTVRVWDLETGVRQHTLAGSGEKVVDEGRTAFLNAVAVNADSGTAVSGSAMTVLVWHPKSGRLLRTLTGHVGNVESVTVSTDGRVALSGSSDKTIRVWDTDAGQCLHTLTGHDGSVTSVAMTPDGRIAISASDDATVRMWDIGTLRSLLTLAGHAGNVESVAVRGDGRAAVSGSSDKTVRLWDLETGRCLLTLTDNDGSVSSVAMSPDGRLALSAADRTAQVREMPQRAGPRAPWRYLQPRTAQDLSQDAGQVDSALQQFDELADAGHWAAAAQALRAARAVPGYERHPRLLERWRDLVGRGRCASLLGGWLTHSLTGHRDDVDSVACNADGRIAVSGGKDATVKVWDVLEGECLHTLAGHTGPVTGVAVCGDGRLALSCGEDSTVRVWDVVTGRCLQTLAGHTGSVKGVTVKRDGRLALSCGVDRTVRVWALGTDTRVTHKSADPQKCVAVSADGRLAASSSWGTVRVFDVGTGEILQTLAGHTGLVEMVAISADGRFVASGAGDCTIRLWEAATGRCLHTLTGHTGSVTSVAVSDDGRVVVSGSSDRTIRVWEAATGRFLQTLTGHPKPIASVAISGNQLIVVSGSADATVGVWELDWELEFADN